MDALIFAAGLGTRMRPLTDTTPKPLLSAGGKALIAYHLEKLANTGIQRVFINTSHLAECFPAALGNGDRWGLDIHYLYEGNHPLETGGGLLNALTFLEPGPFLAINGDIFTDFDFSKLPTTPTGLAHLVLVNNPPHHPQGDFCLAGNHTVYNPEPGDLNNRLTFSGIGIYKPELIRQWLAQVSGMETSDNQLSQAFKLAPVLRYAMGKGQVTGCHHHGLWTDVGTPERLQQLDKQLTP